ncbi:MAG: sensor histidine kinase [Actinobacteria bacterium]|nr:sensor histidine kinase [Actinomycetota bacterium]
MQQSPPAAEATDASARRRTVVLDAALVVASIAIELGGTAAASRHNPSHGTLGAAGIVLLLLGIAALPFRRRFPISVLAVTFATTLAYWSLGYARGPVFLALIAAFVTVVLEGRRAVAVATVTLGFVLFSTLGWAIGRSSAPPVGSLVGLAAWLLVLLTITELVRNRRERAREAVQARQEATRRRVADERLRIAQELHDVVAHSMSLINLRAGVALHLLDTDAEQARAALSTIKDVSKEGLTELRSILGVLRQDDEAAPRAPVPGLQRLDELVGRARQSGVRVRVEADGDLGVLPRNVDLAAYRIIQESLTNVARHSNRPDANVRLCRRDGMLDIGIVDEGVAGRDGMDVNAGGHGIAGMRERVASVGGVLTAGPRVRGGFEVHATLPFGDAS